MNCPRYQKECQSAEVLVRSGGLYRDSSRGFALVIALGLMAFVLLLLLSITTLVQVEVANTDNAVAKLEAEQAALLSLNLAIGKLQETAGLDQRVTAPAEALATVNAVQQLTGVWRSWEGSDHESNGLPIAPNYDSKLDLGDLDIEAAAFEEGRFLGWLVSSAFDPTLTTSVDANSPPTLAELAGTTAPLVGKGSVGIGTNAAHALENEVHVQPTLIDDGEFEIAWWISGENTKALLKDKKTAVTAQDWSERLSSSAGPEEETFDITDTDDLSQVSSRGSLNLLPNSVAAGRSVSQTYFHDLTTYARGLLTNTANGGWRRDLSLMSEQWGTLESPYPSTAGFPFYTLSPGVETQALKNSGAVGGLIYPWAEESIFSRVGGASVGWGALFDFATQYQEIISGDSSGNITFDQSLPDSPRDGLNRLPILARIHWVLSFSSVQNAGVYDAYLNIDPVVTYWNPYSVSISGASDFWLQIESTLPYKLQFFVGDEQTTSAELADFTGTKNFTLAIPSDSEVWQPGEARVYSVASKEGTNRYLMKRGYEDSDGFNRKLGISGDADELFTVALSAIDETSLVFDANEWRGSRDTGKALKIKYELEYADAELYWGTPEIKNTSQTMETLSEGDPSPFMIELFQLQNIAESAVQSRGYSHRRPILYDVSNINSGANLSKSLDAFPFDVTVLYPNGNSGVSDGDGLPVSGATDSDPYSFIGTSFRIDDGLKSLVVAEIPTRPLRSLGELQHFELNAYNPVAPFIANPIGNSNASHMIEPDAVFVTGDGMSASKRVSYDHSYVGNHLFFDDWFVSSIAPETSGYSSSEIRSTQEVYRDFISAAESLPNGAYLPADILDVSAASAAANSLIADNAAWYDVASKIEVQGMFNVNSTSVEAWTAQLKHLKDGGAPYVSNDPNSTEWSLQLSPDTGHPVSRTTVSGDPAAGPADYSSAIGEHARLTDSQIEALAVEIVNQVKARGPFLSLSEFMNRMLTASSSKEDRALAGAVEAALIELSTRGASDNPFSDLQATFRNDDGAPGLVSIPSGVSNVFPAAAEGHRAYGFPGWVRQADILRPLAPVLSARDDTFLIRAYGGSKDPVTGENRSEAWCEAVVQRRADYVDSAADTPGILPSDSTLSSEINKRFGRRYTIVSFRWLSPDEV